MIDKLSPQAAILQKGLDAVWKRGEAIAANIANAETPGYKSLQIDFESVFREALDSSAAHPGMGSREPVMPGLSEDDLERLTPRVTVSERTALRMDGNNVDVDAEMTELAKNSIIYDTLTYAMSREIGRLRLVINEGK